MLEQGRHQLAAQAEPGFTSWLASAQRSIPSPEPVAAFSFEIITNDSTPDRIGTNAAALVDTPLLEQGKFGKALKFSGDNSVDCKGAGAFHRTSPFSFSLWVKPTEKQDRAVVFHRSRSWTDSGSRGYELLLENGTPTFSLIHFWPGNAIRVRTQEKPCHTSTLLGGHWLSALAEVREW
jgi:hypothetical protein